MLHLHLTQFATSYSAETWHLGTTTATWILFVPETATCDAHAKVLIFGFSQCYLNEDGKTLGVVVKHQAMQLPRSLASLGLPLRLQLLPREYESNMPLWCVMHAAGTAWLSKLLGVLVLTPCQAGGTVGGSHSPHAALTAAGLSMEERQAIVDRIVALPAAHREAALAAIPSEINSDIRALVRSHSVPLALPRQLDLTLTQTRIPNPNPWPACRLAERRPHGSCMRV